MKGQYRRLVSVELVLLQFAFSVFTTASAFDLWFWHLRDLALRLVVYRNDRKYGLDLVLGLARGLLKKVPKSIDENVVGRRPSIFLVSANLVDPTYGCPVFCSKA